MATAPPRPRGAIPTFSNPAIGMEMDEPEPRPSSQNEPPPASTTPTIPSQPVNPMTAASLRERVRQGLRPGPGSPRPDTDATRITSSAGPGEPEAPAKPLNKADATAAIIGAVGVLAMAGAFLVNQRYRGQRKLRVPSPKQERDIAEPATAILLRHAKMVKIFPDLIDGLKLVAATGSYLNDGPLTQPRYDAGDMPQGDNQ